MGVRDTVFSTFREIIQTAVISLGIFFFVYIFLIQPHRVKGESMFPNFADGELLLTEKVSYRFGQPKRGDVIVFQAPGRDVDFIKRVIGLPGETVQIANENIFINGQKITEDYTNVKTDGEVNRALGKDEYFVMGDNRGASLDSRAIGPIKKNTIRGKAWLVYWPVIKSKISRGIRLISGINYGIPNAPNN